VTVAKVKLSAALLVAIAVGIGACSPGMDDTVLPGKREDAIPGQSVFPRPGDEKLTAPVGQGTGAEDAAQPETIAVEPVCPDPANPECPAEDAPSGGTDGTFSDGQ
jgi:hypothetical protein